MPLTRCKSGMRKFTVERPNDISGVSGTGIVCEGIVFSTGACVVHWLTPAPKGSISIWDSFDMFYQVHIGSHPENHTRVHWFKEENEEETVEEM